jgi:5-methylcytosine-specific restriction endonuclease McrA
MAKTRKTFGCSVAGCDGLHEAKGMCHKHYCAAYHKANAEAINARHAKNYATDPTKKDASTKAWRETHRESDRAHSRAWQKANPEKANARSKRWRKANPEQARAIAATSRKKNIDKNRERNKKFRSMNPDRLKIYQATRRSRKLLADGFHTLEEVQELYKKQQGKCAICSETLCTNYHEDHILPLARGGSNWINNIQLTCPSCNRSKGAKHPIIFMQERGLLL